VRRKVERLVGSQYSSAVPGLVPNIVPAPSVTFVSQLWRVHCACGRHIYSGANVGVHPRRTLCAVGVERFVRAVILAARLFHSQILASAWPLVHPEEVTPGSLFSSRTSAFTLAPLVARSGGTPCSDFHFGCSAVPFPAPNRLFLRRIRPHQRPGGSSYFPSERQRSPDDAPCAAYGGTPCSTLSFSGFSCL